MTCLGPQVKERAAKAQPVAKQVKILRDSDKAGADGQAASKGLGFVELTEHEHALCALRQLNNNPVPFGARFCTCIVWVPVEQQHTVETK